MPKVLLKDVVARIKDKVDKDSTNLEYYIGGEHFDYAEVCITKRGVIQGSTIGPAFHMHFMPGDVLLMSRNPHLRKAGVVDFEGICSDVSYVCRTKDESVLMQRYLPFVFQTDHFWEFAERNKKGSTNFFLNWSDFDKYEFDLPGIEEQRKVTELLWAAQDTKMAYQELLRQSDELVKSQFIEIIDKGNYSLVKAGSVMSSLRNGLSPSTSGTHFEKVLTLSAITQGEFDPEACKSGSFDEVPPPDKRISCQDFYICRGNGNKQLVGSGVFSAEDRLDLVFPDTVIAAKVDNTRILLHYLYVAWKQPFVREQIEKGARTTNGTYKINQKIICDVSFPLPPMNVQREFLHTITQFDKSKFSVQIAIYRDVWGSDF